MLFCENFLRGALVSASVEIMHDGKARIFCIADVNILSAYQNFYNVQKLNFKPYQFTAPEGYQIIFSANKKIIDEAS